MDKELNYLLISIIKENDMCEYNIAQRESSEKGDGYTGTITTIDIVGKDDRKKIKNLHLIAKSLMKLSSPRELIAIKFLYDKEIYAYNHIFPTFNAFEQQKSQFLSVFAPKFYKSRAGEALILENLTHSGYSLYDRRIPMDDKHVRLVMQQYGRFHALSFALRDQTPTKFNKLTAPLHDIFEDEFVQEGFHQIMIDRCTQVKTTLDRPNDAHAFKKYETFLKTAEEFLEDAGKPCEQKTSVILHGDCWTNNMMFKYEDENDTSRPTQVSLIDFQFMRLGSPVFDLSYFFYACGNKKMFSELDEYLQVYYDSFSQHLKKLGSDPEKLFSYLELKEHWRQYARYGLIFAIWVIYIMLTDKTEVVDLSNIADEHLKDAFNYNIANLSEYNDRVKNIILHFVANKFI